MADELGVARFPGDPNSYANTELRFGSVSGSTTDIRIDWDARTLTAALGYELEIKGTEIEKTRFPTRAEILVNDKGRMAVQSLRFEAEVPDLVPLLSQNESFRTALSELEKVAKDLLSGQRELTSILQDVRILPVIRGTEIRLEIQHAFDLEFGDNRCAIPIDNEVELDTGKAIEAIEKAIMEGLLPS
ncbi:hypothetical protein [Breoghania sp.]|uniref:hypothetical protein n=1 Tax=Breoghania sp. TaxID=2065378 RepID=UPI00262512BC|nr:hypothetical protein [Breoghania sp.]MDJ0933365.1 hypothetical protein [Breoghania sp.]